MKHVTALTAVLGVVALSACSATPPASTSAATSPAASASPSMSGSSSPEGSATDSAATPSAMASSAAASVSAGPTGQSAQVDDLVFSVISAKTVDQVDGRLDRVQKGHWLAVRVRVTNKGEESVVLNTQAFQLNAAGGKKFQTDDPAMFIDNDSDPLIGEDIAAGNSADGTVLFSVPKPLRAGTLVVWKPMSASDPGNIPLKF